MNVRKNERLRTWFLLAMVALVYANTLLNQFTLDDGLYIMRNPQVTQFSWRGLLAPNQATNVFRPFTFATLAFNWALQGAHPLVFHLLNLLLHAAVTLLLYLLLCALLEETANGKTVALVAAALFAVHPIHTEAVASIAGRSELLAAAFLLGAWILHLRRSGNTGPALLFAGAAFEGIGGGVFAAGAGGRLCPRQVEAAFALRGDRWRHRTLPRAALEGARRPLRPARHRTAR